MRVGVRHRRTCRMPCTLANAGAHVFYERTRQSGFSHAGGRPHLLGGGVDRGRPQGSWSGRWSRAIDRLFKYVTVTVFSERLKVYIRNAS